ncbi:MULTISPECIES: DUF4424 domain-containing protein [unclassified Mesorhizobium]|uniref:DUF4424 domain-containing protein n=4 Tax=Mesorhizobium TaxID=68287 RepID=UPI000FCBA629|nr:MULTISPECIES: DUF4424 domain-containing protein [unclassified Mesorhizobium]RUW20672.1 DUF4424 domain-containing protein [Mesorhizobium sp. M4B.F.Ca.ET.013.02.1.1]RVD28279.1 DUF4424 domain-containing protein [Mesorhizobium sp. M4B.F.Ca.ET.017.02.2.1]RVD34720.1 DUF4424 domain-containing protein [Mesorhizobium sp. M4B.F.Ca.ET.019.03.1.1]RWF61619.1 MAG: DUF4424 domain-containing protein [Mesorhizobium sp.]TGQ11096.1 DUF4424 domain-containing protein [Mesorhizobium sp. M4B.F.Ca.ET.215.01.1.1]
MFRTILTAALALSVAPALANDSIAELGTGGLILSRSDAVAMESEDLFISQEKVTVDYVFRNNTDKDVSAIVAFPMPDIEGDPNEMPAIPEAQSDNFLGFEVTIDGVDAKLQLEQKAFALGIDISADLKAQNVPLYPFGDAAKAALAKLPKEVAEDWENRGIIIEDTADDGSGMKTVYAPFWQLRSTYWWRSTFPANKAVHVSHRYKPSVGRTSSVSFFYDGQFQGQYATYKTRYCMDDGFENAVRKAAKDNPDGYPQFFESRIAYILTTGGNWASGNIGDFKLTIDKGSPKNLVSFCGDNVRKVGPTTFEMTAKDFYPEHDIDILLLEQADDTSGGDNGNGG